MDRNHPEKLPAIQLSFIQHLVSPLFQGCAEAGIIPGILVPADTSDFPTSSTPLPEPGKEGEAGESESKTVASVVDDLDVGDDAFALDTKQESTSHKFMSLILTNLHINYEGWRAELPKEEDEEKKEIEDGDKEDKVKDPEGGDSEEKEGTVCVCVCVCVREREREKERDCIIDKLFSFSITGSGGFTRWCGIYDHSHGNSGRRLFMSSIAT